MKGTGIFEVVEKRIKPIPVNVPIKIVFFGDVHYGSPCHSDETFDAFCDKYRGRLDCWYIGMGDYLDLLSASERKIMSNAGLHESTAETFENMADGMIRDFAKKISFMKGRLLVMLEGNHHWKDPNGITTARRLLQILNEGEKEKASYGGDCCMLRLALNPYDNSKRSRAIDIALHHGIGSGRTSGSMFNGLDHFANAVEADVYAMGDNHQLGATPSQRLYLPQCNRTSEPYIKHKKIYRIRTGSFLRGYVKGKANYVTDKLLRPAQLGNPELHVTFYNTRREGKKYEDLVMEAMT